jgi:hypothetical protein
MQRRKGASYEREVAAQFSEAMGRDITRHLGQARDGGHDIAVPPLVVECKRRKTLTTLRGWMNQCIAAVAKLPATHERRYPAVVCRDDGDTASMIVMRLQDFLTLTADVWQEASE